LNETDFKFELFEILNFLKTSPEQKKRISDFGFEQKSNRKTRKPNSTKETEKRKSEPVNHGISIFVPSGP
jgi:hypothetical protein